MLRKYPIDLPSFRKIREDGYVYIDKTEIIHQLVETGNYYFLSRPRRFGKSLLVGTIEELFNGSKELFDGLWIHDKWDFTKTHPVIHFDFSELPYKEVGLTDAINQGIARNAEKLGVEILGDNIKDSFRELIVKASFVAPVVILIDEYDKPIIDFLGEPDQLDTNRSIMKSFYSILKGRDKHIRLLLITGVSQFSRVSVFSDLNNLRNITLTPQFGALVGISQAELEMNFAGEIAEMQKNRPDILQQVKQWYNGYTWNMQTWVYNPFSLLNFMIEPDFNNYWFETGTPTFLLRQLKKESIYDVESFQMSKLSLSTLNTENPNIGSLLFQTGYLTIKNISPDRQVYDLGFPNLEVKASLLDGLLSIYRGREGVDSVAEMAEIKKDLMEGDIAGMLLRLNAMIAKVPYDLWKPSTEAIFHALTSLIFNLAGVDVYTEVHSAKGRCDVLVKTNLYIYVLELKLDGTAIDALAQIVNSQIKTPKSQVVIAGVNWLFLCHDDIEPVFLKFNVSSFLHFILCHFPGFG